MELVCKFQPFNGFNGEILFSVLRTFRGLSAEDHFGVVDEIMVDGKAVCVFAKLRPRRFKINRTVALLQEQNVGYHVRTGVCLERIVGKTNGTQQLGTFRDILSGAVVLAVQRIAGSHKRDDTARTHLIECLGKKVIVNRKTELVVSSVVYLILSEWHIADGKVIEIAPVGRFKSGDGDIGVRVKLLCNPAGDAVQFHAIELAALHLLRQTAEEVADAHRRLQNVAGPETHIADSFIDRLDNRGAGVVRVQRGGTRSGVFLRGKCGVKLGKLVFPVILAFIKGICQTSPADVFGENVLFFGRGLPVVELQLFQQIDRVHVPAEFRLCAADTEQIIRDAEVLRGRGVSLWRHSLCVRLGHLFRFRG